MLDSKTVYIIDTMALIFRNFHRIDNYLLNDQGQDLNSVYGTFDTINKCINAVCPDYVALVFDPKDGSFRSELSEGSYKSNRGPVDQQLLNQIPMIIELAKAMGFKVFIKDGFEADDVIASLATKFANEGYYVEIESGDKDFIQLINKNISLVNTLDDKVYDYKNAHLKFGVPIEYAVDYQALVGDTADNIPGVQKIGPKTAISLINNFGSIKNIYDSLEQIRAIKKIDNFKSESIIKHLTAIDEQTGYNAKESAFKSYELATLRRDIDVSDVQATDLTINPDLEKICALTQKDSMFYIRRKLTIGKYAWLGQDYLDQHASELEQLYEKYYLDPNGRTKRVPKTPSAPYYITKAHQNKPTKNKPTTNTSTNTNTPTTIITPITTQDNTTIITPITTQDKYNLQLSLPFVESFKDYLNPEINPINYVNGFGLNGTDLAQQLSANGLDFTQVLDKKSKNPAELQTYTAAQLETQIAVFTQQFEQLQLADLFRKSSQLSIYFEQHPDTGVPIYLGILASSEPKIQKILVFSPEHIVRQSQDSTFYNHQTLIEFKFGEQEYSNCFSSVNQPNAGYQAFIYALTPYLLPAFTTNSTTVLVNKLKTFIHQLNLTQDQIDQFHEQIHDVGLIYFTRNSRLKSYELIDLANYYGKTEISLPKYTKTNTEFSEALDSCSQITGLMPVLFNYAQDTVATELYTQIEQPLWKLLYAMEKAGIKVDRDKLTTVKLELEQQMESELANIYQLAGQEFNPKSPKQVAEVLFDVLDLPDNKKRSTSAEVLEELRSVHPIIDHILNYRSLSTMYNNHIVNYLKLSELNDSSSIYTTFMQTEAVTGRLSSVNPNLQNVPVRGELAGHIRACFIPNPNCKLVSLDYSQIELRVSAFLSQDDTMIAAFAHNEDIHAKTAAKIFNVALDQVTSEQRRIAKAINFGLNYGKTSYSLSKELGNTTSEAASYIKSYFATYPKIKQFIENTKANALAVKYVSTINNRIIPFPNIDSKIRMLADSEKRNAINYPIQGSASEIMKVAMVNLYKVLRKEMPEVVCHLQIHDELVFSIPQELVETYVPRIKEVMETCFTKLGKVKLRADVTIGDYWTK